MIRHISDLEAESKIGLEREIGIKLQEAEREAEQTDRRYTSEEVLESMMEAIEGGIVV